MKRKLLGGIYAGAAAIALAAVGTTYSAWSDFGDITGNNAGAGTLNLSLDGNNGSDVVFKNVKMAPGQINAERQVWIASNKGDSTPNATLAVSLKNLQGTEDGCDGNGEKAVNPNCADTTSAGQFITDATAQWYSYIPKKDGVCNQSYASTATAVTPQWGGSLKELADKTAANPRELTGDGLAVKVPYLAPGQGMCFAMELSLAKNADNASQGDSASFDLHFILDQYFAD